MKLQWKSIFRTLFLFIKKIINPNNLTSQKNNFLLKIIKPDIPRIINLIYYLFLRFCILTIFLINKIIFPRREDFLFFTTTPNEVQNRTKWEASHLILIGFFVMKGKFFKMVLFEQFSVVWWNISRAYF